MKNSQFLAQALIKVQTIISQRNDIHILHTSELQRKEREYFLKMGWIQEIVKGWYLLVRPDLQSGDSSAWYASFWDFLFVYLNWFFAKDYCLSAEHSLNLHLDTTIIPKQVIAIAPKGRGAPLELPYQTSLFVYSSHDSSSFEKTTKRNLQVMTLPYALCKVSPTFFELQPHAAEIALQLIKNPGDLLQVIVKNNFVRAAGRLIGAYRFLKNQEMVKNLLSGFDAAGIKIQETNPFLIQKPTLQGITFSSSYALRIKAMWSSYREKIIQHFPSPPGLPKNSKHYLNTVIEQYSQDAYHSLSIEGYQVNNALIERVKNANWAPDHDEKGRELTNNLSFEFISLILRDFSLSSRSFYLEKGTLALPFDKNPKNLRELSYENKQNKLKTQVNTLAARGYFEAFEAMKVSLQDVLKGTNPGAVAERDISQWFLALFNPNVKAGLIDQADLFGYRRFQVYIRNSRHTPLPPHALNDAMSTFFECLNMEKNPAVRAILGHFVFVFIHPYMDGNGRIGRLLMNIMLASGGYPWTIIHLEDRAKYLEALEQASSYGDIVPFVKFIRSALGFKHKEGND